MGYNQNAKRGRPTNTSIKQMFHTKRCKGTAQSVPFKDIRRDGINHWPIWSEKRIRCKFPNCKGYTQTECEKCNVGLCYNKVNNCFKIFHYINVQRTHVQQMLVICNYKLEKLAKMVERIKAASGDSSSIQEIEADDINLKIMIMNISSRLSRLATREQPTFRGPK
ncbi:hypothetical protein NPIL_34381 [Nephila pilipes]|uniref:Uncharacterized protein n=1 Tax=Nephila pilipes TaxID=299642 RepID=A0A8X6N8M7_NEPPI|nr:hypothetical protein NPIL_34381 [Nephila pilipes]